MGSNPTCYMCFNSHVMSIHNSNDKGIISTNILSKSVHPANAKSVRDAFLIRHFRQSSAIYPPTIRHFSKRPVLLYSKRTLTWKKFMHIWRNARPILVNPAVQRSRTAAHWHALHYENGEWRGGSHQCRAIVL